MYQNGGNSDQSETPVKCHDDVNTVGICDALESGNQNKLNRNLRQAEKPQGDGEFEPEIATRWEGRNEHKAHRQQQHRQKKNDPKKSGDCSVQ